MCCGSLWSQPGCMLTSAVAPLSGGGKTAEWGSLRSLPFRCFPNPTRPINTVALCLWGTRVSCLGKTHVRVIGTMKHHWIGWLSKWHFKNGLTASVAASVSMERVPCLTAFLSRSPWVDLQRRWILHHPPNIYLDQQCCIFDSVHTEYLAVIKYSDINADTDKCI